MVTERTRKEERKYREQLFRDEITADFRAGKVGIENGWLVEYHEPCKYPCAGVEYGCPPSCYMSPIMDLWLSNG